MAVYSIEGTQDSCYPGTTVLINKLGLKTQVELDTVEKQLVLLKSALIEQEGSFKNVSFAFYKKLHKELFCDLYDWAGCARTISLSKKGTVFYRADDIERIGTLIFKRLDEMNYLKGIDREHFACELAELYHDLNMLHPFREGNGRTLRLFITLLVRNAGYDICFAGCDSDILMIATIKAAQGDLTLLRDVFSKLITE